jgi:hypothetical protein
MTRSVLRGVRVSVAVAVLVLGTAGPSGGRTSDEMELLALTNEVRASVGAAPLALDGALSAVAGTWSSTMAIAGAISHNPSLKVQVPGFRLLGENVGRGDSVEIVHDLLVASPAHYANITNPRFTTVGLGVVRSGRTFYVTQVFLQPAGSEWAPPEEPPPGLAPPVPLREQPATTPTTTALAAPATTAAAPPVATPARGKAVTGAQPDGPSSWHLSVMGQLASWDRLAA